MPEITLTPNAMRDIFSRSRKDTVKLPIILQTTATKPVFLEGELKKYRVMLTDGVYQGHGLIDEVCVPYLSANNLTKDCYVQINEFSLFSTQKRLLLVKDIKILGSAPHKNKEDLIVIDNYFQEHPEDDDLFLTKAAERESDTTGPGFFGEEKKPQPAQQPKYPSAKPATADQGRISPIESLSPYQNSWKIKARVSFKGDLKNWSNARGEGKLFSVNLLDESDEIRATAFNDVAEKLYLMLQEGKVYYISKGRLQASKKPFNTLPHPFELSLDRDTVVEECFDTANVPTINFNFVQLNQIQDCEPNSIIDVIGALKEVNPAYQITAKSTGKAFDRRNITIVDQTGFQIDIGLWNKTAVDFNVPEGSIVAFKACKVQDFQGRSLSLTSTGTMVVNPETPECFTLKGWFDNGGVNENFKSLKVESSGGNTNRKTIAQAEEEHLGHSDKPDYFNVKGTIGFAKKDNFAYPACTNIRELARGPGPCNKKLVDEGGSWRCVACNKDYSEPTYRYIFTCTVMDHTGQFFATLFDQDAQKLLGIDATALMKIKTDGEYSDDDSKFMEYIKSVFYKECIFRIKAKQDSYNDVVRVRYQAVGVDPIDYSKESELLLEELSSYLL